MYGNFRIETSNRGGSEAHVSLAAGRDYTTRWVPMDEGRVQLPDIYQWVRVQVERWGYTVTGPMAYDPSSRAFRVELERNKVDEEQVHGALEILGLSGSSPTSVVIDLANSCIEVTRADGDIESWEIMQ